MGPRSPCSLAVLLASLGLFGVARGQVVRSALMARDLVPLFGVEAAQTLELPPLSALGGDASRRRGPEPPDSGGEERLATLIKAFLGDEIEIQSARGMLLFSGTREAFDAANAILAAIRGGMETHVGLSGFLRRGSGPWQRTGSVEPDAKRRFAITASAATLKAAGTFDECVASGLVATAPGGRQMLWHGVRVTVRPTPTSAESFWAHGSALLASEDDSRFEWGGAFGGSWSVRAEHSPPKSARANVRLLALGPLVRRPLSPQEPRLSGGVPARDEDVALTQEGLRDALIAKAPVADVLRKVKLCTWREFVLLSGSAADVATIEDALVLAATVEQARIEVALGVIAKADLDAALADGSLGPGAAASLVHARVPAVVGQPFGLAFVTEAAGQPVRGTEVEGLALARPDGGLTLVALVASSAPLAGAAAGSRPANDKRIVRLQGDRWRVLEHARLSDGQERVVLVRAHREAEARTRR